MDSFAPYSRSPPIKLESGWNGREDYARSSRDPYRQRSPGPQDRRPRSGRGRSRSPVPIDRYQPDRLPRDDYYNASRTRDDLHRRRSPPPNQGGAIDRYVPGQEPSKPVILHNPLPNPINLDYQVGFNFFAEWWRVEHQIKEERERQKNGGRRPPPLKGDRESREDRDKERSQIQAAYDAYKEKLQVQMARSFVQQHKGEEWFKERYLPEVRDPFRQRLSDFRLGVYNQWERDLDAGIFDEFTLEGIYKNDSNGAGGVVEKEEGETMAAAEVLGVGDLVALRGGDLRDEAALQPALLIKTIAPTVSREKMEAFCKEHLGEGEGGFRWLSLSDPNPAKKCHRIGWVMLNPGSEVPPEDDDRGDGRDEDGEVRGGGDVAEDGEDRMITNEKGVSTKLAEKALAQINGKTIHDEQRGDFTCHVGIHLPPSSPRKKALWDLFAAPERIDRDLQLVKRLVAKLDQELGQDVNGVSKVEQRIEEIRSKGWLQPAATSGVRSKKSKAALGEAEDRENGEDGEMEDGEEEEDEEGVPDEEVDDEDLLIKKKTLDLLVEYLRRVFNFCFFCVFESDSVHELARKCPGGHLRRPRASLTSAAKSVAKASASGQPFPIRKQDPTVEETANGSSPVAEKKFKGNSRTHLQLVRAFNWVKTYEDKLFQILEPESVDIKKLGGKPVDEAVDEELQKYVKQEDEAKFRCKVPECTKLFKGENFWRKHVEKRHTEWLENLKKELNFVNTYVLDPSHIAPSRSDANSNGHFPTHTQMPAGTPRGFNLSNMAHGFPGMPTMPNAPQFATFFGPHPVTAPNWSMPVADFAGGDRHDPGAMRRGGGRFTNNRPSGPYDRQARDSRNMRWNGGGRLTPPRVGAGRSGGRPSFADAGGAATVGPREAVQGRSLKSYEDLDAVGTGGSGELNY